MLQILSALMPNLGLKVNKCNKTKFVLICLLLSMFILCLSIFIYLQYQVVNNQNSFAPQQSDALIVLGHATDENSVPEDWLAQRLETALQLYNEGYAPRIIVAGGKGADDKIPVSESMKKWLVERGVKEYNIFVENQSLNTYENFKFSKTIAESNDIHSVIVITNDFHIYRSMLIADEFFSFVSGQASPVAWNINKILAYLKEPLSIINYKIFLQGR